MSKVKSFAVGDGDMFYIKHNSDSFTTIDCCLDYDDESKAAKKHVLDEISRESQGKGVTRFISTHPDEDHISGLDEYDKKFNIRNFYCVKNEATKNGEESEGFKTYKLLRDDSKKQFSLEKGCTRKWLNVEDEERGGAGIHCLWPITSNQKYRDALEKAKNGDSPNDISPAIRYIADGFSFFWMGDMETEMQQEFDSKVDVEHSTIVFAPHHGRKSGHIPSSLMDKLSPKLVIVGEADASDLDYYKNQNTITQNTAKDILFVTNGQYLDIYVSNASYCKTDGMINNSNHVTIDGMKYLGSVKEE